MLQRNAEQVADYFYRDDRCKVGNQVRLTLGRHVLNEPVDE
jgi:hypothetical protein